jgi:hypothetical protein
VRKVAAALAAADPVTGEGFENTILLVKCADHAAEAGDTRAAGGSAVGAASGLEDLGGSPIEA